MQKYRSYILPIAIILGLLLHHWCAMFSFLVPYIIFSILLLTFSAVDIRKLRMSRLDIWLMLFQITVSLGSYLVLKWLGAGNIVAEGVLIGVLCPVASSVAVISCMLGANRETVTAYTIIGNLMVAVVAPIFFSFIGTNQDMPFFESFFMILKRIGTVLGIPFFIAWALLLWWPKASGFLCRYKGLSFYLWSLALLFTLGQTIDFIFLHGEGNWSSIAWLGVASLMFCIVQFGFGRWLGGRYGDKISGGQLLGQKNTAMGIWMANYYLTPLASVFMAFYSIFQNVWNSWQMWKTGKEKK
ncbi:MAG: transporter [Bacteroidales bacterium]|nr:transporter [Bacteroidales bacterium]